MGAELTITRTPQGADEAVEIPEAAWQTLLDADPSLMPFPDLGPGYVIWRSEPHIPDDKQAWLYWCQGTISTRYPEQPLFEKMLEIAETLNARIRDDDDKTYRSVADWAAGTQVAASKLDQAKPTWWRRWFSRSKR